MERISEQKLIYFKTPLWSNEVGIALELEASSNAEQAMDDWGRYLFQVSKSVKLQIYNCKF